MKILVLNASPRREKGNTHRITKAFLEGAVSAGADAHTVFLYDKRIGPCLGCFHCWVKEPGKCVLKDDMGELLMSLASSDVCVFATPLYFFGMTAQMKLFVDRMIPLALPFVEIEDGHCTHPVRPGRRLSSMVVISNCGFHELDNFDEMMSHFCTIARHAHLEFAGALLRPHGELLPFAESRMPQEVQRVYEAARRSGVELVETGRISQESQQEVARELLPLEAFVKGANLAFQRMIKENERRNGQ